MGNHTTTEPGRERARGAAPGAPLSRLCAPLLHPGAFSCGGLWSVAVCEGGLASSPPPRRWWSAEMYSKASNSRASLPRSGGVAAVGPCGQQPTPIILLAVAMHHRLFHAPHTGCGPVLCQREGAAAVPGGVPPTPLRSEGEEEGRGKRGEAPRVTAWEAPWCWLLLLVLVWCGWTPLPGGAGAHPRLWSDIASPSPFGVDGAPLPTRTQRRGIGHARASAGSRRRCPGGARSLACNGPTGKPRAPVPAARASRGEGRHSWGPGGAGQYRWGSALPAVGSEQREERVVADGPSLGRGSMLPLA